MSSREGSRDRELVLSRHQTVPMWDSSDPERAPPPLPLNPGSPSPVTKGNVSPNIQAVAANFTEKMRESSPTSPYTTNPMPPKSPEKSLIKGQFHKRMQSLQNTDTRSEFLNYLENRSPERPLRATFSDQTPKQAEKSAPKPETPPDQQSSDDLPSLQISNRYLSRPLFGESTPPSATMLALQNMQLPPDNDPHERSMEAEPSPDHKRDQPHSFEFLSNQILSLTDIASGLQREMMQLSRRSKDNATDLVSLKAATNARDEDIRKSLRDLSSNLASKFLDADATTSSPNSKKSYSVPRMQSPNPFPGMDREFCASPGPMTDGSASIALLEKVLREMATKEGQEKLVELVDEIKARPVSEDSGKNDDHTVTEMLEEILNIVKQDSDSRALVRTRAADADTESPEDAEGDVARDMDVVHQPTAINPVTEEMLNILKHVRNSVIEGGGMTNEVKHIVRELRGEVLGMGRNLATKLEDAELTRAIEDGGPKGPTQEEITQIVDSSLQELKEQMAAIMESHNAHSSAIGDFRAAMGHDEIHGLVKKALDESPLSQPRDEPDGARMQKDDILEAVREAWETYKPEIELQNFGLERDEILECLAEGLKSYQPQHEQAATYDQVLAAVQAGVQSFEAPPSLTKDEVMGVVQECLEKADARPLDGEQLAALRDEILGAVTKGLEESQSRPLDEEQVAAMREEFFGAVVESLEKTQPRSLDEEQVTGIRDQLLSAVTEGLDKFEPRSSLDEEQVAALREEFFGAVTESLEKTQPRSLDEEQVAAIRDQLLSAVTDGLDKFEPRSLDEEQVAAMREEFFGAVTESLEKTQPRSLDDEQVAAIRDHLLTAVTEGLEKSEPRSLDGEQLAALRDEILNAVTETMTSQSALTRESFDSSLGRDEILNAVSDGMEAHLAAAKELNQPITKEDVTTIINDAFAAQQTALTPAAPPTISRDEILQIITEGLESQNSIPREIELNKEDLMEAITAGLGEVTAKANQGLSDQFLERLKEQLDGVKEEIKQQPATEVDQEQIINTIKDSIAVVREDVEGFATTASEASGKLEILDTVKEGFRLLQADLERTITENALVARSGGTDTPELLDAMEKEFEHLRQTLSSLLIRETPTSEKDEILDAIRDLSENQKAGSDDSISGIIKAEFESLRESMNMSLVPAEPKSDKDEIVAAVQATLEAFHEAKGQAPETASKDDIIAAIQATLETSREQADEPKEGEAKGGLDKDDLITTIQATLEAFHDEKNNQEKDTADKDEILAAIREIAESQKATSNEDISNAIKAEFESLHDLLTKSVVPAEQKSDKDDIIAAVQAALETFHAEKGQATDAAPEGPTMTELKDTYTDGVGLIKDDIAKLLERPAECNSSELLDSLKEGLSSLKTEVEALRQSHTESEENATAKGQELMLAADFSKTSDIEGLKTLISDIQTKVDAIEAAPRAPELPEDLVKKEHMDEVLAGLLALQTSVDGIAARETPVDDTTAKKEDTDAIETLLRNTKSQLDEMVFPAPDEIARAEQLGSLEEMVKDTKDVVAAIQDRLESECPTKAEIGTIETLLKDMWLALDDSKPREGEEGEKEGEEGAEKAIDADAEKLVKSDLQTVEAMIFEVKNTIDELKLPEVETLPTKDDVQGVGALVTEVKTTIDELKLPDVETLPTKDDVHGVGALVTEVKTTVEELKLPDVETLPTKDEIQGLADLMTEFKEKVEADHELTGQGFEARKIEHAGLAEKIDEAKTVVEGLGDELKGKLDGSQEGLTELKTLLEGLTASSEKFTTVDNVKELTELINREFERARGEQDGTKLEHEERDAAALVKHDETKAAIVVELGAKIDEKLGEVIAKYDEAQSTIDTKFNEAAERGTEHLEAVTNTKTLAEDIKLVIGSMGDSVNEACEKMSAEAKTFMEKVDASYGKMEEMHNEFKTEQEQSRSEAEKVVAATERVETKLHEFHPQVLESIQEILSIVGQHYNHSQESAKDLKMDLSVLPTTLPQHLALPPPEPKEYDDSQVQEKLNNLLENSKGTEIQDTLNTLIEKVTNDQVHEKLDQLLGKTTSTNGEVYEKLNELLEHATNSNGPVHEKLDTLIGHATNNEHSANQMMKLDEMHKDIMETQRKMNEMLMAQSALVAEDTERRRKEAEEAAVALERRTAQREQMEAEIETLRDEKDSMLAMMQRLKTEKDGLAAQTAKLNKEVSALETALELRHEEMQVMEDRADSLEKRILEGVLDHARTVLLHRPNGGQGITMKKIRAARARNSSATSIASTAKGAPSAFRDSIGLAMKKRGSALPQAGSVNAPNTSKERRILSTSHVTGNRGPTERQSSTPSGLMNLKRSQSVKSNISYRKSSWGGRSSIANKENEVFPEEEENRSDIESDAGTERRTSYTGTYADSMTYGEGSVISASRQPSMASTTNETVTTGAPNEEEEEDEDDQATEKDEHEGSDVENETPAGKPEIPEDLDDEDAKMVVYAAPSDSGLGAEITSTAG
ncbi:uncharacterized protein BDV14DRAFT_58835 [Aspergillus stella-maris]|uniref:uncharacterized protein n=1 Tax=Aspergillus stella-maris TaxID=1810926 RepID=UPI003CCE0723